MEITLEIVRQILKEALGFNSFVASFITEVHQDKNHPTAGITKNGELRYNPEFIQKYVSCKEDLFSLIFHELLHPMFGHFIYSNGDIENIAADAIINAVIATLYPTHSNNGNLFKKTHRPRGLEGIMRPQSQMHNSRYEQVYQKLYYNYGCGEDPMTTGELIQTLKILTQTERLNTILLIGTHSATGNSNDNRSALPNEVLTKIAEEIKESLKEGYGRQAGYNNHLVHMLMEALHTHLSIKKVILQKFTTKRKIDRFKELFQEKGLTVSPIPIHPSKRDLILLSVGQYPFYFHNNINKPRTKDKGLAIYLDVSGSVNEYLPKIIGILRNLKKEITTIFQFSNKVVETSFETLLKGNIETTYGTDFNCIAKSILEKDFDKAVIITDGYASMDDELKKQLQKQKLKTLTILFDDAQTCEDFEEFGEIIQLEETIS